MMEGAETDMDRQALVDIKDLMDFFVFVFVYTGGPVGYVPRVVD